MILTDEYCQVLNESAGKQHGVFHHGDSVINHKADIFQHRKAGHPGTIAGPEHENDDGEKGHMVKHRDGSEHFHKTEHLTHY